MHCKDLWRTNTSSQWFSVRWRKTKGMNLILVRNPKGKDDVMHFTITVNTMFACSLFQIHTTSSFQAAELVVVPKNQESYTMQCFWIKKISYSRQILHYIHGNWIKNLKKKPPKQKISLTMHDTSHAATNQGIGILLQPWDLREKCSYPMLFE